jgi:hypothetical protein
MNPQYPNCQTGQTLNRPQPYNQPRPMVNDAKIKEIVLETLIELNLVPKPERKKAISTV